MTKFAMALMRSDEADLDGRPTMSRDIQVEHQPIVVLLQGATVTAYWWTSWKTATSDIRGCHAIASPYQEQHLTIGPHMPHLPAQPPTEAKR